MIKISDNTEMILRNMVAVLNNVALYSAELNTVPLSQVSLRYNISAAPV